ncbi:MAG: glycosyltransferase [Elusimicrobiota bacterium]|nr:glycosyltransferase [Endomicrobiia bacterium]MDW8166195.1 glycosyltransferase [Elusimicrobiota bacterium]
MNKMMENVKIIHKILGNASKSIPKISVIIPSYNYSKFVGDCIKSILKQSWKSLEIILVDDGSTDDTHIIVKNIIESSLNLFKDHIDFLYVYQENKGYPSAHNTGLKISSGEYVLIIDADDYLWEEFAIEKLYYNLVINDGVMAFGKYIKVWENGKTEILKYSNTKKILSSKEAVENLVLRDFIPIGGALIKGDIAREIGFDERIPFLQDYPFKIKIASRGKVIFLDEIILAYRQHNLSVSSCKMRIYSDTLKAIDLLIKEKHINISSRIYKKSLSRLYYKLGQEYELKKNLRQAFYNYTNSLILYPFNYKTWILLIGLFLGGILKIIRMFKRSLSYV